MVVAPSAKRTRLMPKSSAPAAVRVIVVPRSAEAGAVRVTPLGASSKTGIGAVRIGQAPPVSGLVGSLGVADCGPLRYGKKSTEFDVAPPPTPVSWKAVPLTPFSGTGGLTVGL